MPLNEAWAYFVVMALATIVAIAKALRLRDGISAGRVAATTAGAEYRRQTIRQVMLAGTAVYWCLWLLPEALLRVECGHNCYGVPIASFLMTAICAVPISLLGEYLIQRNLANGA